MSNMCVYPTPDIVSTMWTTSDCAVFGWHVATQADIEALRTYLGVSVTPASASGIHPDLTLAEMDALFGACLMLWAVAFGLRLLRSLLPKQMG